MPLRVQAGQVYALLAWTPDELAAARQEVRQVAQAERAAMGVGQVAEPLVAAVAGAENCACSRRQFSSSRRS